VAFIDLSRGEIQVKVVYYGPGRCGKTTNLLFIHESMSKQVCGKMVTIDTRGDRTLFFDFLPLGLGRIMNLNIKIQLYTVPGQVMYNSTRKLVLRGVDGVAFIADPSRYKNTKHRKPAESGGEPCGGGLGYSADPPGASVQQEGLGQVQHPHLECPRDGG